MTRRVLITGGAGFIGSHLVGQLVARGEHVEVIDDLSRGRRDWLPEAVRLHQADIRDADAMQLAVDQAAAQVVVHLAALHFIPAVDGAPELAWQVNVDGTKVLLDTLAKRPPEALLFASTAAVYPDRRGPIVESCPVGPIDLYGKTKVAGEELVAHFDAKTSVRCVIARLFNVIGERETNPHVVPELIQQLKSGATHLSLGKLDSTRDYTDVVDVAGALALLLQPNLGETVFNVGSGRGFSVAELVSACERILGRRLTVTVDPKRLRGNDRNELIADVNLLKGTTGWSPNRSTETTLANLLVGD
jgi:UDP-glucose 4-epimerase